MRICTILLGCLLILSPYWDAYSEPITQPQKEGSIFSKVKGLSSEVSGRVQSGINSIHKWGKDGYAHLPIAKEKMIPVLSTTKTVVKDLADKTADNLPAILSVLSQTQWLKYLETITASAATKFDKALDAKYLQTALGGCNHRMFDGGHTPWGAWSNVTGMCAKTQCSSGEQLSGYLGALWKDAITPKGLPFITMEKQTYDSIADTLKRYGINKNWTYDALSYDALEVLAAGISAAAAVYLLKTEQIEELSEALGAMGVVSVVSANPILALVMTSSVAYAIATGVNLKAKAVAEGVAKTSIISGALVLLPTVFLLQITTAVALSILLEKGMTEKNYLFAKDYILEKTSTLKTWGFDIRRQVINTFVEKAKTLKLEKFYDKSLPEFPEMI